MVDRQWCIYALLDPRFDSYKDQVRYIGWTYHGECRLLDHIGDALFESQLHVHRWIRQLLEMNLEPLFHILHQSNEPAEYFDCAERFYIKFFRDEIGSRLTNLTDGGEGTCGLSADILLKRGKSISDAKSGKPWTIAQREVLGQSRSSPEFKEKMRVLRLGTRASEEARSRMSTSQTGRIHTEETKIKMSQWVRTAETRDKMRQASTGRRYSEETCKLMSESHIGHKLSLESRKKVSEALSRRVIKDSTRDLRSKLATEQHSTKKLVHALLVA